MKLVKIQSNYFAPYLDGFVMHIVLFSGSVICIRNSQVQGTHKQTPCIEWSYIFSDCIMFMPIKYVVFSTLLTLSLSH